MKASKKKKPLSAKLRASDEKLRDVTVQAQILDIMRDLKKELKTAIVMISATTPIEE